MNRDAEYSRLLLERAREVVGAAREARAQANRSRARARRATAAAALAVEAAANPRGPRPLAQAVFGELEDLLDALEASRPYGTHVRSWPEASLLEADARLAIADTGQVLYDGRVPERQEAERILSVRDDLRLTLDLYGD